MASPFISREDLSEKLGFDVTEGTEQGELAQQCVDAACDWVRGKTEQTINAGSSTVVLDGTGTEILLLPQYPVRNVVSVSEDAEALTDEDWVLNDATGGLVRVPAEDGYVSSNTTLKPSVVWNRGRQNIQVSYEHGYADADIPRDVRMAAESVAVKFFRDNGVAFESLGAYSVRFAEPDKSFKLEERILEKYKRYR
jgi:hypothetical protein